MDTSLALFGHMILGGTNRKSQILMGVLLQSIKRLFGAFKPYRSRILIPLLMARFDKKLPPQPPKLLQALISVIPNRAWGTALKYFLHSVHCCFSWIGRPGASMSKMCTLSQSSHGHLICASGIIVTPYKPTLTVLSIRLRRRSRKSAASFQAM